MVSDVRDTCFFKLRINCEILCAIFCCLMVVGERVDSTSISELLTGLEMEGNPDYKPQEMTLDDIRGDVSSITGELPNKRVPWVPYEVNVENLKQKLMRTKQYSNREKHAMSRHHEGSATDLSIADAFVEGYIAGWLKAEAGKEGRRRTSFEHGTSGMIQRQNGYPDALFQNLEKRGENNAETANRMRSTSSIHPIYLGMGQETANAALDTFESLIAEEEKRKNSNLPTNPVRFIGKRFSTDE